MVLSYLSKLDDGKPIYATYLESIVQSIRGRYVKSGCLVVKNSGFTVTVGSGVLVYEGEEITFPGKDVTLSGPIDKDRADVIVYDVDANDIVVLEGTRWLNVDGNSVPITERISDNQIPLAIVIVRSGTTELYDTDIIDVRCGIDGLFYCEELVTGDVMPDIGSMRDIGGYGVEYNRIFVKNVVTAQITSSDTIKVAGTVIPDEDSEYDLGSNDMKWKDVYTNGIVLANGYRIMVYDVDGSVLNGFRVVDVNGNELIKVTTDGIWFLGNKLSLTYE